MMRQLSQGSGSSSTPGGSPKIKGFWQGRRKKSSVSSGSSLQEGFNGLLPDKIFVRNHNEDPIVHSPLAPPELEPVRSNGMPSPDPFIESTHDSEYLHLKEYIRRLRKAPSGSDPKKVDATWEIYKKVRDECLQLCKSLIEKSHTSGRNASFDHVDTRSSYSGSFMDSPSNLHPSDQRVVAIQEYKAAQEQMLENFRSCLLATYTKNEPEASDRQKQTFLDDLMLRKGLIVKWRESSIHAMKSEKLLYWEQFKIRSLNFDRLKLDLKAVSKLLDKPEPSFDNDAASSNIRECVIAKQGDTILEFGNKGWEGYTLLRFRVSSHLLAESSPLFAQMLLPQPPGSIPPVDMENQLPGLPGRHVCKDGMEVKIYRMPQIESNTHESLTILLHAAHMHNNKVPRKIEFPVFVSIAEVCLRYRCTSPLELQVEYQWLPQWIHMASDNSPDGLLLISFAFGLRRIFTRMSKTAVLNVLDDEDIQSRETWPQAVKDKIKAVRAAKLAQIHECCTKAIEEYFRPPSTHAERRTSVGSLVLTTKPRCPKGQHLCDATNLGWLMLVYNELRVLPSLMNKVEFRNLPATPRRSLKTLVDSLRLMPSAPQVHSGVCDYAPAFRSAIDDIYNSVKGLTLWDVTGRDGWALSKHAGPATSDDNSDEITELPGNSQETSVPKVHLTPEGHISSGDISILRDSLDDTPLREDESDDLIEEDPQISGSQELTSVSEPAYGKKGVNRPHISIPPESEAKALVAEKPDVRSSTPADDDPEDIYCASPRFTTSGPGEIQMSAEEAHRILWPDEEYSGQDSAHPEENEKVLLHDIERSGGKPKPNRPNPSPPEEKAKFVHDEKHLRDEKDQALGLGAHKQGRASPSSPRSS